MDLDIKELCRLCSKHDLESKDLMDEKNTKLSFLIQKYIHISLIKTLEMPLKICPSCEVTVITFNSFVENCEKTQEVFKMMCADINTTNEVKIEKDLNNIPEVKTETLEGEGYLSGDDDYADESYFFYDEKDDEMDNMTIAQIKTMKCVPLNGFEGEKKNRKLLKKDLIKLNCHLCQYEGKNWSDLLAHCVSIHATDPEVNCACGYSDIKSKSDIDAHIKQHSELKETKSSQIQFKTRTYQKKEILALVSFACLICSKPCHNWTLLHKHCKKYHSSQPLQECKLCGLVLKSRSSVYRHAFDHRTENIHRCSICSKILTTAEALKRHQNKHERSSKCVCAECGKVLTSNLSLKSHMQSHIPINERKNYECIVCSSRFTTRSALVNHKRAVHEKTKRFVCDLCGFSCVTAGELKQHRAIHSDDKPFTCPKCDKKFKTYSNMKTHMDIHAETSYSCDICNKVLNSKRTLRKHILVHQTEKKYACHQCNKAFKRSHTLKVHMAMHTGDKPVSCKWCGEKFTYSSGLRAHRLRFHPDKNATTTSSGEINRPSYTIEVVVDGDMVYGARKKEINSAQLQLGYKEEEDKTGIINKILNL